jgi:hypothetical protein
LYTSGGARLYSIRKQFWIKQTGSVERGSREIFSFMVVHEADRGSVDDDIGDISAFPEPTTNPIIAHCGICGPIGANGSVTDIPEDYNPDDYPKDDICDDCLRQEEHHYTVTRDMALDAGTRIWKVPSGSLPE